MIQAHIMGDRFHFRCSQGTSGRVHSVFDSAVNIDISVNNSDVSLLTLLCAGSDVMPASLVTSMRLDSWHNYCKTDEIAIFTPNAVYLNAVPIVSGIATVTIWKPADDKMFSSLPMLTSEEIAERGNLVKAYLKETGIILNAFSVESLDSLDVNTLIGHGTGLTPSGDDFLSGLLAAMHFTRRVYDQECDLLQVLANGVLQNMATKTNQISRHFLHYAVEGLWGRATERFMFAFFGEDELKLYDAILEKAAYGGTSGVDEIQGVLFGLYETVRRIEEGSLCI